MKKLEKVCLLCRAGVERVEEKGPIILDALFLAIRAVVETQTENTLFYNSFLSSPSWFV